MMNPILEIASRNDLFVIEDCAQSAGVFYNDKMCGSLGHIGCFSFIQVNFLVA